MAFRSLRNRLALLFGLIVSGAIAVVFLIAAVMVERTEVQLACLIGAAVFALFALVSGFRAWIRRVTTELAVTDGLAFGTAAVLRWTTFGTSMRAVADDPDAARLWGINVNRVMAVSWVAGSAMGAIAGVLIVAAAVKWRDHRETIAIFRIPGAWEDEGFKILEKYGIEYYDRSVSMHEAAKRAVEKIQG